MNAANRSKLPSDPFILVSQTECWNCKSLARASACLVICAKSTHTNIKRTILTRKTSSTWLTVRGQALASHHHYFLTCSGPVLCCSLRPQGSGSLSWKRVCLCWNKEEWKDVAIVSCAPRSIRSLYLWSCKILFLADYRLQKMVKEPYNQKRAGAFLYNSYLLGWSNVSCDGWLRLHTGAVVWPRIRGGLPAVLKMKWSTPTISLQREALPFAYTTDLAMPHKEHCVSRGKRCFAHHHASNSHWCCSCLMQSHDVALRRSRLLPKRRVL
jgi:hypothetical protein